MSVYGIGHYLFVIQQSQQAIETLEDSLQNHPQLAEQIQGSIAKLRIREEKLLLAMHTYLVQAFPPARPEPRMRVATTSL